MNTTHTLTIADLVDMTDLTNAEALRVFEDMHKRGMFDRLAAMNVPVAASWKATAKGRPAVHVGGTVKTAAAVIIEHRDGEPTSYDSHAGHTVGAPKWSIAPWHLERQTMDQNVAQRVAEAADGSDGRYKGITHAQAVEITVRYVSTEGLTQRQLAEEFGISQHMVSHIVRGKSHIAAHAEAMNELQRRDLENLRLFGDDLGEAA